MRILTGLFALIALGSVANAAEPVVAASPADQRAMLASDDPQLEANKRLVWNMWREFLQGGDLAAADKYLAPEYHQHNPNAETGSRPTSVPPACRRPRSRTISSASSRSRPSATS
jgi:hypothetical protein